MATQGMRNTIRFLVKPDVLKSYGLSTFVQEVLFRALSLRAQDIFCLQDNIGRGLFDVTFETEAQCLTVFERCKGMLEKDLKDFTLLPMFQMDEKPVTVHLFNPFTELAHVVAFLQRYCSSVRGGTKLKNGFGIPNGKLRFWVRFRPDPAGVGGISHPPASFSLGGNRGYLVYPGQPRYCRLCLSFGHTKDSCPNGRRCRNCGKDGHDAGNCPDPRVCDLCGDPDHLARGCPKGYITSRSYADAARGPVFFETGLRQADEPAPPKELSWAQALGQLPPLKLPGPLPSRAPWMPRLTTSAAVPDPPPADVAQRFPVTSPALPPDPAAQMPAADPELPTLTPSSTEVASPSAGVEAGTRLRSEVTTPESMDEYLSPLQSDAEEEPHPASTAKDTGLVSMTPSLPSSSGTVIPGTLSAPPAPTVPGLVPPQLVGEDPQWDTVRYKAKRPRTRPSPIASATPSLPCAQQQDSPFHIAANPYEVLASLQEDLPRPVSPLSDSGAPESPYLDPAALENFAQTIHMPQP